MRAAGERREQFPDGKRGAVSAGIRAGFIHSANAGEIEPVLAAKEYQAQLDVLAARRGEKIYEHDLILLGLGDDGHTASLFPGTEALSETERRVVANYVPKLNSWRLTFTFPLIFAARAVCFLIGANKDPKLIERIFSGDPALPAARVDQNAKSVTWIIEQKS